MLLIPDPNTAFMDPFLAVPTLVMIGDATDPPSQKPYHRDPRHVVKRADAYLKSTGFADTAYFGAVAEFFIFDSVGFDSAPGSDYPFITSIPTKAAGTRAARMTERLQKPRLSHALQESATSPSPLPITIRTPRWSCQHDNHRHGRRMPAPRSGHSGRPGRKSTYASTRC